jgi:hypothetical protein
MGTAQAPQQQQPEQAVEPRSGTTITPTPTPHEINTFLTQQATGSQPPLPWFHQLDGSAVDPKSFSTSVGAPTWP